MAGMLGDASGGGQASAASDAHFVLQHNCGDHISRLGHDVFHQTRPNHGPPHGSPLRDTSRITSRLHHALHPHPHPRVWPIVCAFLPSDHGQWEGNHNFETHGSWHILLNRCLRCCCMRRAKEIECELSLITPSGMFHHFLQCHSLFEVDKLIITYASSMKGRILFLNLMRESRWTIIPLQKKTGPKNQISNKRRLVESKNKCWAWTSGNLLSNPHLTVIQFRT